jgi:CheY-like chemotaxis protein
MRVVTRGRPPQQMGGVVPSCRGPTTDKGVDTFRHLVGVRRPQLVDFTSVPSGLSFARIVLMAAILVVDDDADLRSLAQIILEQSGYQVLVAADGRQALQIAQHDPDPIDLLLTDVVMPGMDGAALGRQLRLLRPAMRILYMTALAVAQLTGQEIVLQHIRLDPDVPILVKPFSVEAFQQKVRDVLDPAPGHSLAPDPPEQLRPVS